MNARRLHAILKRHEIHPKFWPEFRAMVELGQTPGKELWTRMSHVANFRAARSEIAAELSKGLAHEFPPDDYEVPAGYDFDIPAEYESLTPEDVVLATSAGAPSAAR